MDSRMLADTMETFKKISGIMRQIHKRLHG